MNASFADIAVDEFSFLFDLGFNIVSRNDYGVEFKSTESIVCVSWDPRSGELNVSFGLVPAEDSAARYSLTDILSFQNVTGKADPSIPMVPAVVRLRPWLAALADDARTYARLALAGDRMFFRRLDVFRHSQSAEATHDIQLRQVRSEIEKAWRGRDLAALIDLCTSIEKDLSEAEKLKLAYARKHQTD